jgi:hypothetical protein
MQEAECVSTEAFVIAAREWNTQRVSNPFNRVKYDYVKLSIEHGQGGEDHRL